ncbi:ATP-dependent nuclease [Myroides sp. NP-2]|uniref:ATP-dependent nuclease n=1 Tax=unclassified Myroides TaxID=2642485 RepID=UPI0015F8D92B|nr:AAA family ATPase [Myroides sp. NP-2]MBB1151300.1 AAA family ATPase [Myroides sp. NP-2]
MILKKIQIKRFRSILDLKLNLNTSNNFSTICGANNSGKTNVLKALNIFFNPEQYSLTEDIPNHKLGSRGGSTYPEITLTFEKNNIQHIIKREFGVNGIDKESYEKIIIEEGQQNKSLGDNKEIGRILNQISFFFIPAINISFPTLINNLIDDVYELEYEKARFSGLKKDLKDSFESYSKGLLEILNKLASEINPIFKEFNSNWSVSFENTSDVKKFKDLISEDVEFYLNDLSNRNIEGKGSGLQRLGYILLHSKIISKLKKKNVIFCIDEPDVYLHQGLQKKLHNHLLDIAKKHQVIVTSHSQTFIDCYKLDNVFLLDLEVGEEREYQRTKLKYHPLNTCLIDIKQENGLKKIREYLGITDEDFELLDNYNIILEGESDKKYLSEISNFFGINIPNIISSGGATKIDKYLEFYNNFYTDRDFKPKIRVIFDNDEEGRKEYNRIKSKIKSFKNIVVTIEFIPNCFGETPNLDDVGHNKVKSNFEVEDFIYPEILHHLSTELSKKVNLKTFKFNKLESKIKAITFKDKGILYNIELLKNENNLEDGLKIDFSGEQAKNGMVGLFNIKGNKKLSEMIINADSKYPEVKSFLQKISKP